MLISGGQFALTPKLIAKACLVVAMVFCNANMGFAKDINWKGSETTAIRKQKSFLEQISKTDYSNTFVLYNVGAKKFVYCGGSWGTQPVLSDKALRFAISSEDLYYAIAGSNSYHVLTSTVGSPQGFWLGSKGSAESLFLDCSEGSAVNLGALNNEQRNLKKYGNVAINPQRIPGETGDTIYTYVIRSLYGAESIDNAQGAEKYYLVVDTTKLDPDHHKGCIVLKNYYDASSGGTESENCKHNNGVTKKYHNSADCDIMKDPYAQWRFVSIDEIKKTLGALNPEDMDEPFDCTFFLKDADFNRYNRDNGWDVWAAGHKNDKTPTAVDITPTGGQKGDQGWKMGLDYMYSSSLNDSKNDDRYGWGSKEKDWTDEQKKQYQNYYAKYFCAQVTGLCSDNSTPVNLDQNWTCEKTGWYRVTCQGFVQNGGSYMYAKVADTDGGTTKRYQYVPLRDINDWDAPTTGEGRTSSPAEVGQNDGIMTGKMLYAGQMFYASQYTNTLYIYVEQGQDLEIGVRFRGTSSTWTCVDDFRLAYLGNEHSALVLDEDKTDLGHIYSALTAQDKFKGNMVALHRPLKQEVWNTVVLPVSLTKAQCNDLFGDGCKVAEMVDYSDGIIKFLRTENESTGDNEIILTANKPCIVKPYTRPGSYTYTEDGESNLGDTFYYTYNDSVMHNVPINGPFCTTKLNANQEVDDTYITSASQWDETAMNVKGDDNMYNSLFFYGTLIKTYDESLDKTNSERYKVDLTGKYITSGGLIKYVPTTSVGYGLKGLRGWFGFETAPAPGAKALKLNIDGVDEDADNVTGLEELFEDGFFYTGGNNGKVYNLSGQLVNSNGSTQGLEKGIYIIKGKKVVVK